MIISLSKERKPKHKPKQKPKPKPKPRLKPKAKVKVKAMAKALVKTAKLSKTKLHPNKLSHLTPIRKNSPLGMTHRNVFQIGVVAISNFWS